MQVEVLMPKMGESITEGRIVKWHKKAGDKVERDEILLEISTDKVDTEIPSVAAGIISKILVKEQEVAQVGAVIAYIDAGGSSTRRSEDSVSETPKTERALESAGARKEEVAYTNVSTVSRGTNGDRFYSPLVRSIAQAEGISSDELTAIGGTGSGGRITKHDLMHYIENRASAGNVPSRSQSKKTTGSAPRVNYDTSREQVVPMDNMRQRIMEHMVASRDTSVHVSAVSEVDMTRISGYIAKHSDEFHKKEGFKLTFMPFISFACVKALKDYPLVNSSIDGTNVVTHKYINLGIAVAIETTGLLVPVIKGADEKNILGLARGIYDVALRARTKRLTGDDTIGSTFSITNFGVFGNLIGTPVINQPNIAILGVGAVKKRPVVINDAIAIRETGFLTLSFDHRLVDGALGGRFLERVVNYLENYDTEQVF